MLAPPLRQRRPPRPSTIRSDTIAPPIGGINSMDAGPSMPASDCILLYNMVAAEYGLRTRLGSTEWVTGCTDAAGNEVRSILPFTGSAKGATNDKLFACTPKGIWDVSASTQAPSRVTNGTFGTTTGDAGYAYSTVFVNSNGNHFLLVCDEVNGYYVYTESTTTWTKVAQQSTTAWAANTAYTINVSYVFVNGASYLCKTTGTSAVSPATGPSGTGTGIADGSCTWDYTPAIGTGDPTKFAHVTVWGNRVWFTELNTGHAWYTAVGSLFGTVTKFPFGARFRAGGDLRGLYNWTRDGSQGAINSLVGVSGGGDVVVYEGTDPSSTASFGLKGVYSLGGGGVPYGRRIATDYGGDLLLLSTVGVLPLSRLVTGGVTAERDQYATAKIANLFNQAAYSGRTLKGWQLRLHPQDNTLIINAPAADASTSQFVMNLTTKGWSQYRDLPAMLSLESWGGDLYFGTTDGRVIKNSGYVDGVTLATPTVSSPIQFEVLTSFQNLNSQRFKRIQTIRPKFITQGSVPGVVVGARYDYDFSELAPTGVAPSAATNVWGTGVWGTALWGGTYASSMSVQGAIGSGVSAAVIVRGTVSSRVSLTEIDVMWDEGGIL